MTASYPIGRAVIPEILANAFGSVLKQPVKRMFDEHERQRVLTPAVNRAEERFARDYHNSDAELVSLMCPVLALLTKTCSPCAGYLGRLSRNR